MISYPEPDLLALIQAVAKLTGARINQTDAAAILDEIKAKYGEGK